jgi:REP element-mobilizing transposase RayT
MARPHRLLYPGAVYHVWAHVLPDTVLYPTDRDVDIFFALFEDVVERHGWSCLSWCLLDTHYHLLVRTLESDLDAGMKRLNGCYAQGFNRRHGRRGHLFEDRYGGRHVDTDAYLRWVVRYIARNPLEAGVCGDPLDWPLSSLRQTVEQSGLGRIETCEVLRFFGSGARLLDYVRGDDE